MFKYVTTERHLISKILEYERKNVRPILDYAIEKLGPSRIDAYTHKRKTLFEMFPNSHHSLKLSAIGFDDERLFELMNTARDTDCTVLVDAEESNVQAIIDAQCNAIVANGYPRVYKTYQMYRKDSMERLLEDIETFKHCDLVHNIKLVRGAYILTDDRFALHDTKEQTDKAYNNAVKMLLRVAKDNNNMNVVFATHNTESIDLIKDTREPNISHAFLMGMEPSGILDAKVNKMVHVPFGPVHMTSPYLARRFIENNRYLDAFLAYKRGCNYS